jgi:hypothetical protein
MEQILNKERQGVAIGRKHRVHSDKGKRRTRKQAEEICDLDPSGDEAPEVPQPQRKRRRQVHSSDDDESSI